MVRLPAPGRSLHTCAGRALNSQQVHAVQAFFAPRAASWEERFPDDEPRYEAAIVEIAPPPGSRVLDVGCGTGRATPFLHDAVGADGAVVAIDLTPEMLATAARLGRSAHAAFVLTDGERLPFADASFQIIFAAGFVPHLSDVRGGLAELARVTAKGGRLAIFHPIGRAALAARHGGTPSDDDVVSPARLPAILYASGWALERLQDTSERYLAIAERL